MVNTETMFVLLSTSAKKAAVHRQFEIGVQLGGVVGSIFSGREHDQKIIQPVGVPRVRNDDIRKKPLLEIIRLHPSATSR